MIKVGEIYTVKNQGTNITPISKRVKVVWFNCENVWYTLPDESYIRINQTTVKRFMEIIGRVA